MPIDTRNLDTAPSMECLEPQSLYIVGASGKIGKDLDELAVTSSFTIEADASRADFVVLCTPSHVSANILDSGEYNDKRVIDMSGAAKQRGLGQYCLMGADGKPWDSTFDTEASIYANPGCIASAVIAGLGAAGITEALLPSSLAVFSVGGQTHAPQVEEDEIMLARRLNTHPHVAEIERAFRGEVRVASFMPTACDVPQGLFVGVHGTTVNSPALKMGSPHLKVSDVVGTSNLRHHLELSPSDSVPNAQVDFSLGVVIDNLRYITHNVLQLIRYLGKS